MTETNTLHPIGSTAGLGIRLMDLVLDSKKIDSLLESIDDMAKTENAYEYGLPLYDEGQKARLREVVLKWIAQAHDV